ncbi:putative DMT superfamily transporter inner membrane protein [Symmachiella dynata]|uniref:Putative DMT superfamily transporter inner membrane protein n=1 Tax=Symmachiella dynata TaxID=2527995 RepID=A0A517ZHK4_9PLAN|nr:DMT family transporter [Symmachiella dynata]QDU41951.1 putative DMT superfamily transporter inner membrane protein [Symmachiella dynata]
MTSKSQPVHLVTQQPLSMTTAGLCVLMSALWGANAVAVKFSTVDIPAISTALIRFVLATLFMLLWCRWEGVGLKLNRTQFRSVLITGVLLFLQIGAFHLGVARSSSSHATLFVNTYVFWVVALEHFVMRATQLSWNRMLGLLIAGSGVVLIVAVDTQNTTPTKGDPATLAGDLMLLASGFLLGVKIIYTKHALRKVQPGPLTFHSGLVGVVLFAIYTTLFEGVNLLHVTPAVIWQFSVEHTPSLLGLLYQGVVVAGFCFALSALLLRRHAASQISVFSFASPLFGLTFSVIFRGDQLSPWLAVAALCVIVGIWLVTAVKARGENGVPSKKSAR